MQSISPQQPAPEPEQQPAQEPKGLTIALDGPVAEKRAVIWSGPPSNFHHRIAPFILVKACSKQWILKPMNVRAPYQPLGVSIVDTALRLGSSTGVLPAYHSVDGQKPSPIVLEGFVGGVGRSKGSDNLLWDATQQKLPGPKAPGTSICDLLNVGGPADKASAERIELASYQRLSLLCLLSRCGSINSDDILLRKSKSGGFEAVLGDAQTAFTWRPDEPVCGGSHYDEPADQMRPPSAALLMPSVLTIVEMLFRDEWLVPCEDYGWFDEDGNDRRKSERGFVGWEKRPLTDSVAALVVSWSVDDIECALHADLEAFGKLSAMHLGVPYSEILADEGNAYKLACAKGGRVWAARWKDEIGRLQERLRCGERPSLLELARGFLPPPRPQRTAAAAPSL